VFVPDGYDQPLLHQHNAEAATFRLRIPETLAQDNGDGTRNEKSRGVSRALVNEDPQTSGVHLMWRESTPHGK